MDSTIKLLERDTEHHIFLVQVVTGEGIARTTKEKELSITGRRIRMFVCQDKDVCMSG